MKRPAFLVILGLIALMLLLTTSCSTYPPQPPQTATGGAEQVQSLGFDIPKNSQKHTMEQQNIIDRLKVTTDPTKVLWIHLIALDGKIIRRMPVSSKVTSSGKRLEPIQAASSNQYARDYPKFEMGGKTYETNELLQPDGTMGQSDSYIYWFDPQHRYHQYGTAGGIGYLLTDYPIDLANPMDEVTGMFNMSKAAFDWQKLQEEQLCLKEGKKYDGGVCR